MDDHCSKRKKPPQLDCISKTLFLLIKVVEDIHSIQLMSSASCDSRPNWAILMAELRRQGTLFRIEYYARTPESPLRGVFWQNVALCGLFFGSARPILCGLLYRPLPGASFMRTFET